MHEKTPAFCKTMYCTLSEMDKCYLVHGVDFSPANIILI